MPRTSKVDKEILRLLHEIHIDLHNLNAEERLKKQERETKYLEGLVEGYGKRQRELERYLKISYTKDCKYVKNKK